MTVSILDLLSDELLTYFIHEWFGKANTLFMFDIAMCNHLLREKYMNCLRQSSKSLLRIPFHIKSSKLVHFSEWCQQRAIFVNGITINFNKNVLTEQSFSSLHCLNRITQLTFELKINTHHIVNFGWILEQFPHLKSLSLRYVPGVISPSFIQLRNSIANNLFEIENEDDNVLMPLETVDADELPHSFQFQTPHPLKELNIERVDGYISHIQLQKLMQVCSQLQSVRLIDCYSLNIKYIMDILHHAPKLCQLHMDESGEAPIFLDNNAFSSINKPDSTLYASSTAPITSNTTLPKKLILSLAWDMMSQKDHLLDILTRFQDAVEVTLVDIPLLRSSDMEALFLLPSYWSQLQTIRVKGEHPWCTDTFLTLLATHCHTTLQSISIFGGSSTELTNAAFPVLATRFPQLQALSLIDCMLLNDEGITSFLAAATLTHPQLFMQLTKLHIMDLAIEQADTFRDILYAFPALSDVYFASVQNTFSLKSIFQTYPYAQQIHSLGIESHKEDELEIPWQQFTSLQNLQIQDCCLTHKELQTMFRLPKLYHVSIRNLFYRQGLPPTVLFQRQSLKISHLKLLDVSGLPVTLTDAMIQNILKNAKELEIFCFQSTTMSKVKLRKLQEKYYYRTDEILSLQNPMSLLSSQAIHDFDLIMH